MSQPSAEHVVISAEESRAIGESRAVDHAWAEIDLDAVVANARLLAARAGEAELMAVVKADGYGHGAAPVARAALAGGATHIGVATLGEATALRSAGIDAPLVAWLWSPAEEVRPAVAVGVQIGVSSHEQLRAVAAAASLAPGGIVPVHLKVDTGMGRNGVTAADLPLLLGAIAAAERDGAVRLVGLMSHFAFSDVPDHPSVAVQIAAFEDAVTAARSAGLRPRYRHLANTGATLAIPRAHFDMVRCGIGLYGLSPLPDRHGLTPAMTLRTTVSLTKRVGAGQGVGYGLTYHTAHPTTLALVPVGYGDGIPRVAGNTGEVLLGGRRRRIAGRVAMDQIVIDCGDDPVDAGDEVIVFGPGVAGEPTADDWAGYCDTINYEIVTRISPRVTRRYRGGPRP